MLDNTMADHKAQRIVVNPSKRRGISVTKSGPSIGSSSVARPSRTSTATSLGYDLITASISKSIRRTAARNVRACLSSSSRSNLGRTSARMTSFPSWMTLIARSSVVNRDESRNGRRQWSADSR